MHKTNRIPKPGAGHREKFADGTYVCQGTFGHNKKVADQMAEAMAKRYQYKVKVTEKKVRIEGETGIIRKPIYLIWVKVT